MTRAHIDYSDRTVSRRFAGLDVTTPEAGFYRFRLRSGGAYGIVRLRHGPPDDPITGEPLDRYWRWQADFNGELIDFDRVWPACAKMPATEDDYRRAIARQTWAKQHAPDSAYANPGVKHDPLTGPMPF